MNNPHYHHTLQAIPLPAVLILTNLGLDTTSMRALLGPLSLVEGLGNKIVVLTPSIPALKKSLVDAISGDQHVEFTD